MPTPPFDGLRGLLTMMNATDGEFDPSAWYISLVSNTTGNAWTSENREWEVPGSRVLFTGSWVANPANATDYYQAGVTNSSSIICGPITRTDTVYAVACCNGVTGNRWVFLSRLYNYPVSMTVGDSLLFPAGLLVFNVYSP